MREEEISQKIRWIAAGGFALIAVSLFLPFYGAGVIRASLWQYKDVYVNIILTLMISIISAGLIAAWSKAGPITVVIDLSIIMALWNVKDDVPQKMIENVSTEKSIEYLVDVATNGITQGVGHFSIGFYALCIGLLMSIVSSIVSCFFFKKD